MYHISNRLHVDVTIEGVKIEGQDIEFVSLVIHSNYRMLLPIMQLRFKDQFGSARRLTAFEDGSLITIKVGNTKDRMVTYDFRLFSAKEEPHGANNLYSISGYLDLPKFFIASSTRSANASTSELITTIANECDITELDVESTTDKQMWYQANKRNAEFTKYLASRGRVDDTSVMATCVRNDKKLIYRDINKPGKEQAIFTYSASNESALDVTILAHKKHSKAGGNNLNVGYKHEVVQQNATNEEPEKVSDVELYPRADFANINKNVKGSIDRGRLDVSPIHYKDNVNENFFKAGHQNYRGQLLNDQYVEVLAPVQTKLDQLDFVQLVIDAALTGKDENSSGLYFVAAKDIICKGTGYAEKFTLARAGMNEQKKG